MQLHAIIEAEQFYLGVLNYQKMQLYGTDVCCFGATPPIRCRACHG